MIFAFLFCDLKNVFLKVFFICESTLAGYKSVRPPLRIIKLCVHPRGLKSMRPPSRIIKVVFNLAYF